MNLLGILLERLHHLVAVAPLATAVACVRAELIVPE